MAPRIPVIHRDRTFEYLDRNYRVTQGSDPETAEWDGYIIMAVLSDSPGDETEVEESLHRMSDVRAYLAKAVAEGWPYLPNVDGLNPHDPEQEWTTLRSS